MMGSLRRLPSHLLQPRTVLRNPSETRHRPLRLWPSTNRPNRDQLPGRPRQRLARQAKAPRRLRPRGAARISNTSLTCFSKPSRRRGLGPRIVRGVQSAYRVTGPFNSRLHPAGVAGTRSARIASLSQSRRDTRTGAPRAPCCRSTRIRPERACVGPRASSGDRPRGGLGRGRPRWGRPRWGGLGGRDLHMKTRCEPVEEGNVSPLDDGPEQGCPETQEHESTRAGPEVDPRAVERGRA